MSSAISNVPTTFTLPQLSSHRRRPAAALCVRAMAGEVRENLDHLQRASKQPVAAQAPKKRIVVAPSAPLGMWDRFPTARTIQQMMDTMDGIMEDPLAYSADRAAAAYPAASNGDAGLGSYRRGRTPWEIKEKEGEYKLRFDMPGMTRKDVKVYVEEKMLVLKAEKLPKGGGEGEQQQQQQEEEDDEWPAKSYGKYNCRIALPENVEVEKIKAEVRDGVLYITIPKAPAAAKVLDIDVQ